MTKNNNRFNRIVSRREDPGNTVTVSFRTDPRDLARVMLFFRQKNIRFSSRAAMLRGAFELFIRQNEMSEITYVEAGEILSVEHLDFAGNKDRGILGSVINKFKEARTEIVMEQLDKTLEKQPSFEDLLSTIPETEETEEPTR